MANLFHSGEKGGGKSTKNAQHLAAALGGAGALTALTDSSGGTAGNVLSAISDGPTANAIASLADRVNDLISKLGGN